MRWKTDIIGSFRAFPLLTQSALNTTPTFAHRHPPPRLYQEPVLPTP